MLNVVLLCVLEPQKLTEHNFFSNGALFASVETWCLTWVGARPHRQIIDSDRNVQQKFIVIYGPKRFKGYVLF